MSVSLIVILMSRHILHIDVVNQSWYHFQSMNMDSMFINMGKGNICKACCILSAHVPVVHVASCVRSTDQHHSLLVARCCLSISLQVMPAEISCGRADQGCRWSTAGSVNCCCSDHIWLAFRATGVVSFKSSSSLHPAL